MALLLLDCRMTAKQPITSGFGAGLRFNVSVAKASSDAPEKELAAGVGFAFRQGDQSKASRVRVRILRLRSIKRKAIALSRFGEIARRLQPPHPIPVALQIHPAHAHDLDFG